MGKGGCSKVPGFRGIKTVVGTCLDERNICRWAGPATRIREVGRPERHLVKGLGFRVWDFESMAQGLGFRVQGLRFWVLGLGFGVWGLGFRV